VAIVPLADLDAPARCALAYASAIAARVVAVHALPEGREWWPTTGGRTVCTATGARWLRAALLRRSRVAEADVAYHLLGQQSG
jgi:hypothetical protein